MKKSALLLLLTCFLLQIQAQRAQPVSSKKDGVQKYCTNVGPLELTFRGDSVTGWYQITVTPEPIEGLVKGVIKDGLFTGVWIDKDGIGTLYIGFAADMTKFASIFNNNSKNPANWFEGWKAFTPEAINTIPADQRKWYVCERK